MSDNGRIALYARVSTESLARDHTIASQLAAFARVTSPIWCSWTVAMPVARAPTTAL